MATIKDLQSKIDKLTGKKASIPDELAQVRAELAVARDDLGGAALDGKATERVRAKVAELIGQEAELAAALDAADLRLGQLGDELSAAEADELIKRVVDGDAKFAKSVADLLAGCYSMMDAAAALDAERRQIEALAQQARGAGLAGRVPVLAAQGAGGFVVGVWRALRGATGPVEVAVNVSGGPACLVAAVKKRRKTHPLGSVR